MPEETKYQLSQLFDDLPMSLAELARKSEINEVTLARIRDGGRTRRDTANKLLRKFSEIYDIPLTLRNVQGINVMVNQRLEKREARQSAKQDSAA